MKDELARRNTNMQRLREFFEANRLKWIAAEDLEKPSNSKQAWRTRVSDLRLQLKAEGAGTIQNRLTYEDRRVILSEYRYLPHTPLGRDSTQETPALPLFDDGPWSR